LPEAFPELKDAAWGSTLFVFGLFEERRALIDQQSAISFHTVFESSATPSIIQGGG